MPSDRTILITGVTGRRGRAGAAGHRVPASAPDDHAARRAGGGAGVKHFVYTSMGSAHKRTASCTSTISGAVLNSEAPPTGGASNILSPPPCTILRMNFYAEAFVQR